MRDATTPGVRILQSLIPPAENQVRTAERWICARRSRSPTPSNCRISHASPGVLMPEVDQHTAVFEATSYLRFLS